MSHSSNSVGARRMGDFRRSAILLVAFASVLARPVPAAVRTQTFEREPAGWEGVNNRNASFEPRKVTQDFGFSPSTRHAGGEPGEIGGRINPSGEPAFYGVALPQVLNLDLPMTAEGRLTVPLGANHCLFGFFNTNSLNGWRTPNTLVARINGRGEAFHCHLEYCTARWRAGAGVIGEIVPGERISARNLPTGKTCSWKLTYDPNGPNGSGVVTLTLDGSTARCEIDPDHRRDGLRVTHFGLLPVMKAWDSPGEIWMDDLKVNGAAFDFSQDPRWDGWNHRRTYVTSDTRPKFDFGWSPTRHAGGAGAGELGGLVFRGDCREPHRMAAYGDRLGPLDLTTRLEARGKVSVLRAVSDSTASIGFYHSTHSMQTNPSQKHATPMDYIGINIEGPSADGFYFYPVYRVHGDAARALGSSGGKAPRIYPDRKVHDWSLVYDPAAAGGRGAITVTLDDQRCTLELEAGHKEAGASFDRFGICTPWIDGNSVTVYFDDLTYTSER